MNRTGYLRVQYLAPVLASQSPVVASVEAEQSRVPPGDTTTPFTLYMCPGNGDFNSNQEIN